jgi:hypothetical protein
MSRTMTDALTPDAGAPIDSTADAPVAAITYGTVSTPRAQPPIILPLLGGVGIAIALMTIALRAWSVTHAYYTSEPAPKAAYHVVASSSTPRPQPAHRVSVPEGTAIIDGIGRAVALTKKQRDQLQEVLVACEDKIRIDAGPDPSAASIAAAVKESGPLFGEVGWWLVVGEVRVEVTDTRAKLCEASGGNTMIERRDHNDRTQYSNGWSVLSFAPPPPPPEPKAAVAAPPPPPPTLAQQLHWLAPHLTSYADSAISALLAILLVIASIGLLYYGRRGRFLALTWAWVKLPLALAALCGYFYLQMGGEFVLPRGTTPWKEFILHNPEFVASVLAALFAIAMLIMLNLPHVRRYFFAQKGDQMPSKSL